MRCSMCVACMILKDTGDEMVTCFRYVLLALLTIFAASEGVALGGTVEVIGLRHGESLNNILSQKKSPVGFFISMIQQRRPLSETKTLFHNPLLSTDGRKQALSLHDTLFPGNADPLKLFSADANGRKTTVYVSPLNRTIETALLVFGEQLFKSGVDMVANPLITEHRKSISEDGFKDSKRPKALFDYEILGLVKDKRLSEKDIDSIEFKRWATSFTDSLLECCDEKEWWPKGPVETAEHIQNRISAFKSALQALPNDSRVILVSHGTFLRTFFFGVDELKNKHSHIRNAGMLVGQFSRDTGDWVQGSVSCWDPKTGKSATGLDPKGVCFDKIDRPESIVVDKGPVYEIDGQPPMLGGWQTRQLNIFKHDGVVGVTWNDKGSNSTTKVKGAALIIGSTDTCEIPSNRMENREKLCLVIERVKIDKNDGPLWEKPETGKWEILRLNWKKSDEAVTKALSIENLLQ